MRRGDEQREPIAIVGIGCRFPSSNGPEAFWRTLCEGKDTIGPIPGSRWDADALYDPDPTKRGKMVARTGGFLSDIEGFDWRAFRVSPREAKYMDPQHRLLLEVAWETVEDAGMPFEKMAGTRTAVFVGVMWNDYGKVQALDLESIDGYSASGNAFAFAANRISFFFDLHGPSVALDVSCASSLIAVHLACESIWSGESEMAVAGGVNLIISPDSVVAMSKAGILSAEGHCKPFDASADGFVRGEGAGLVLLKPLDAALADGDRIHAVIRGTAATHSGKTDWIMAPSSRAQEDVYREAYRRAGVDPRDVGYVELHGTGTRKGDPLEAKSVGSVMGAGSGRRGRCIVGSVKTNLGHLDSAAGIAGLLKVVLALEHRRIPGSLNLRNVNPEIDLDALGLDFRSELGPWPDNEKGGRALAGVTGLSFGGANVHVVLEEAPPRAERRSSVVGPFLLPISARAEGALTALAREYRALLASGAPAGDLCAAASLHRTHHPQRLAVAGRTASELVEGLDAILSGAKQNPRAAANDRPVFVFSGQGPQWWAMGRELLRTEAAFRETLERCDRAVARHASFSVLEELSRDEKSSRVQETRIAQPLLFALQLGLVTLLESWGIRPSAVVGHSVGEIAAACVAGVLTLEDAARVAACRGRIMHAASDLGGMVQASLSREEATQLVAPFAPGVGVAAHNGPRTVVLSGETDAVEAVTRLLKERGVPTRPLPVRYAFHSDVMSRFQDELVSSLTGIETREARLGIVSTLFGRRPTAGEAFSPSYWARQMREPVEFVQALTALSREGRSTFVEIGPHPVLASAMRESLGAAACVLPTLVRGEQERFALLSSLGVLYTRGQDVAWPAVVGAGAWAPLPAYPWQREKLWLDSRAASAPTAAVNDRDGHPLLQSSSHLARPAGARVCETILDPKRLPYLRDHRLAGSTVVPASLFVEMAVAAAADGGESPRCVLRDVELLRALVLADDERVRLQLLSSDEVGRSRLQIWSRPEGNPDAEWVLHVTAMLERMSESNAASGLPQVHGEPIAGTDVYAAFRRAGEEYGAAFQGIRRLFRTPSGVVAEVCAPPAIAADVAAYFFHPALLDACMHSMAAARAHESSGGFMPTRFDRIEVLGRGGPRLWAEARIVAPANDAPSGVSKASVIVLDEHGAPVLDIQGISLQYLDELGPARPTAADPSLCYEVAWRPISTEPWTTDSSSRWLVLGDASPLGEPLRGLLEQRGQSAVLRAAGAASVTNDDLGEYTGVVLLAPSSHTTTPPDRATCLAVVEAVRALSRAAPGKEPRLFVVTRGGQGLPGEAVDPGQALLWGLGRSIAAEHPSSWGGLLDVDPGADAADAAAWIGRFIGSSHDEPQLLVRSGICHAARLTPFGAAPAQQSPRFARDAAYLVTGGFGALGRTFARWLLENGAGHVVLMSRSRTSPEHEGVMRELSSLGGAAHHAVADVADEREVREALGALARAGVPPVRGVLHAAGTVALEPVSELTDANLEAAFRAKVVGTWVLDRVFAGRRLECFVLFSSASAVLESASLGAYAAANAYQDALAHARRARGEHALSVNWGPWAGEGMAKETGAGRGPLALRGMGAIDAEQGTALLRYILDRNATQVSVLPIDWATFRSAYASFDRSPFLSEIGGAAQGASVRPRRSVSGEFVMLPGGGGKSRRERIELYLLQRAARALHAEPETLDAESTLIELGLDSLMLVELRLEIERALGVRLRLMDLLSDPSIRELSSRLEPQVKDVA